MLCWFLPYSDTDQPKLYIYITSLLSLPPIPPSYSFRSSQSARLGSLRKLLTEKDTCNPIFTLFMFLNLLFWLSCGVSRILFPWPGIKPVPPAVEAQSLNHWTTRKVPSYFPFNPSFIISKVFLCLSCAIPSTGFLLHSVYMSIFDSLCQLSLWNTFIS